MFQTARYNRISQNIVNQIRQAILNGDLKPGDRLPPEKDLAERFGVSKASLREAFRALEALGLLNVRQGAAGGAFVREVDLKTAREGVFNYIFFQDPSIDEFTQLRGMLEPEIAEIAATRITDEEIDALEENLRGTKQDLDQGNYSYELDIDFHGRIATVAKNSLVSLIIDSIQSSLVNIKMILEPDYRFCLQVYEAHRRIVDALKERDPVKSRQEMLNHIKEVGSALKGYHRPKGVFVDSP